MKSMPFSAFAIAIVLAAGVGAATASFVMAPATLPGPDRPIASAAPDRAEEALRQFKVLQSENAELRRRITELERRPAPIATKPFSANSLVTKTELKALSDKVDGWISDMSSLKGAPEEFKTEVARTLQDIRKQERVAKVRKGAAKRHRQLETRLTRMRKRLNLSDTQVTDLRDAFTLKHERDEELIRQWQEGADDESLGEQKRSNHQHHQEALVRILTPQQLELQRSGGDRAGKN